MPEFETVIESAMAARLRSLHTAFPAKVQTYDASARTADLVPMVTPTIPGATDDDPDVDDAMPVLMNVPVLFPRAGGVLLTLPVQAGDTMLVLVCERDIGRWRATGQRDRPDVPALHGLSGAVAIPGLYPTNAPAPTFEVKLTSAALEVNGNGEAVALASRVEAELAAIKDALNSVAGSPTGGSDLTGSNPYQDVGVVGSTVLKTGG